MSVIPSKIIPTLGSGSGGGGSGGGGSGASIADIEDAVQRVMLKSGSVYPRPDFSRAIPLVSLANARPSVVFKINVPGYLFTDVNKSAQLNNYPAIGHYLASHPGYFHMGVITGTSNIGGFRRPDYLERIMVYHGVNGDATKQFQNRDQIVFIVPGTSTYWQPQFIIPGNGWDTITPHISFVPDLSLSEGIDPKDYVTPIYVPSSCLIHSTYEKNRIGMSGNRWVRDIFRGDWRNNFEREGDTWTLKDPGNIIRNKYCFKGIGGSWGFDNTDWWQTNALDTGKNRVYFYGTSYVLRYITAAEAVAIHNQMTNASSALGSSRLNRDGTVTVEAKAMTYSDYALLLAERWVVLGNTFSAYGINDLAGKIMNREYTWNTQTDVSVSGGVASLTGESSDVKSSMTQFLERTYGNNSVKLDPIDNAPLFSDEDFNQVVDTTVNWVSSGINTYVRFVSKERGLNDPPSGLGEADFYNNSIKKVPVESLAPEDVYVLSKDEEGYAYKRVTAGTGDIKTSAGATMTAGGTPDSSSDTEYGRNNLKILQHCEWFRGPAGSSSPQYIPGLFSRTEKFDIPTPPNCVNVWDAKSEE